MDYEQFISNLTLPELDLKIKQLNDEKFKLKNETSELNSYYLTLERRNQNILEQLKKESEELDNRVKEEENQFKLTKKQCENDLEQLNSQIKLDFSITNKILIENKKKYHHLIFNLNEKKEVEELRKSMLAQEKTLNTEHKRIEIEMNSKKDKIHIEHLNKRQKLKDDQEESLKDAKKKAEYLIEQEKTETLKKAQEISKELTIKVSKTQENVDKLRTIYNNLLEETNELEMQLMEAKLVKQLVVPEKNKQTIQSLIEEKDRLEDERMKARTKPEAENRRKLTQHLNSMKKKQNEINGFISLNNMKLKELNQLRALASTFIEQRNTLMTFFNETITLLRKLIASNINQKGLNFRTSELVLCHIADEDNKALGRMFQGENTIPENYIEQLKFFEVLYSKFTGIVQPRKIEDNF